MAAAVLVGCGGGKGPATTPEGTVQTMVAAIQAGDALGLAGLYDYTESAKAQNENWGEIPKGQQDLILKEEAKRNAAALEPGLEKLKAEYQGAKVGTAQVNGETATVPVETGKGSRTFVLVQREGKWYLVGGVVQ
jgi:hypothetical protein